MHQNQLFIEDENDAIRQTVAFLGGAKKVGHKLWPDKQPHKAGEHLLNSLNPNHAQKLSWSEALAIVEWGRQEGCHVAMGYIGDRMDYKWEPVHPEEVKNQLMEKYLEMGKTMIRLHQQIQTEDNKIRAVS